MAKRIDKRIETKKVTLDCPLVLLDRIDRLADFGDIPRQKLIANLLEVSVDYLEATKKVGVLSFAILMRDLGENATKWAEKISQIEVKGIKVPL